MDWKIFISVIALLVSVVTFVLAYTLWRRSAIVAMKPILVFEYDPVEGWILRNVGNGPALNIILAMKSDISDWLNPVRIPPLSKDTKFTLSWTSQLNVRTFGATYEDFQNRPYSTTCTDDLSRIQDGNVLKTWDEKEISRHWKLLMRR